MRPAHSIALALLVTGTALLVTGCVAPQSRIARGSAEEIAREQQAQREVAALTVIERQKRLDRVAFPIWVANAELCGEAVRPVTGMTVANEASHTHGDLAPTFRRLLQLGPRPRVTYVIPDSPAEGHVLEGDLILRVDDTEIGVGAAALSTLHQAFGKALPDFPVRIEVERDGKVLTTALVPQRSCAYPVRYLQDLRINAFADGEAVYMMAGMMRFAENDQELALILGHELAHNVEGHIDAKKVNATIGLVFDLLAAGAGVNTQGAFSQAGANSYSQDFESEADYVGLYYLARAGIEVDGAAHFWRRMAAEHPGSIRGSYQHSHPSTALRFTQLERAAVEIRDKVMSGTGLIPNRQGADRTPTPDPENSGTPSSHRSAPAVRPGSALWRR